MLIDLTCPAEVFQTALPTDEIPAVSLSLYNLSDRVIVSAEVTLKLLSGSGSEKERVVYRARALNGRPHSTFLMSVPCSPNPSVRRADVTIDKVWFNDNAVWRREMSASTEYTPNDLPVSRALTNLRFVAGETAVGFPSQQEGLWVCVCGRPNPDSEEYCARCRRQKEAVFIRYNREAVDKQVAQRERQLDLSTRNVREDTTRMQRIREEEYNRKQSRKARRKHLALSLPVCAAIVAVLLFAGVPALRFWTAERAMAGERWTDAAKTLRDLGSFPGAEKQLEECEWQAARELHESAVTAEEFKTAADALRAVTGHPESIGMAEEDDLARARISLDSRDTEAAWEALESLSPEDPRRTDMENEILFTEAKIEMGAENYAAARELFLTLTDAFPDAADLAAECVYIPASRMIDEGRYTEAISEMNRIPEHPQSRNAILECHYRMGEDALEAEDLETAAAEFLLAGSYGDAAERSRDAVFAMAENAYAAGDIAAAQALYASIPGYEPADARNNECLLALAKEALENKEYERSAELLAALPEGYPGAEDLIPRVNYLAGTDALRNRDYEQAVLLLERAGEYRDAASKLDSALDTLIKEKLKTGDIQGAQELLPRITRSKNYEKYRMETEYLDAVAQTVKENRDPEKLAARFEALGSYRESESWARDMYYEAARIREEQGDTLKAAREYAKAGNTEDAAERAAALFDMYYGKPAESARAAMEAGNWSEAVTLLEALDRTGLPKKYADLPKLYEDACVKAGEALYQAGRPYEAARFFRLVEDPRRVSRWMSAACYRIIGKWADRDGNIAAEFREDSTCTIAGESFVFLVQDSYTLRTETDGEMAANFRISTLTDHQLTLRDMREGRERSYELRRVVEDEE